MRNASGLFVAASVLVASAALAAPAAVAVAPGAFHHSAPLAADRAVRLDSVLGSIEATPSTDGKLDVVAAVKDGDASLARVVAREEAGGVAVCVLFPEDSPDDCRLDGVKRATRHGHDHAPTVDLIARVPKGVRLVAQSVNGAVRARGLTGNVRASTVNGDVVVETSGVAEATTVNGGISVVLGAPPRAPVAFTTTNGKVTLTLPAGTDADVEAETVMGSLSASFPIDVS